MIAAKIKRVSWDQISIERTFKNRALTEKDNGRTLADVNYSIGETFTVV